MTAASSAVRGAPPSRGGRAVPPADGVVVIEPSQARGTLLAPPSKSYTHRGLLVMALAPEGGKVLHPLVSEDTEASRRAILALGGEVRGNFRSDRPCPEVSVRPIPFAATRPGPPAGVDAGESGTTLRLFSAAAALAPAATRFEGAPSLARRPMAGLLTSLRALGAEISGPPPGRSLPFTLRGPLRGGRVEVPGDVSSQFVSALLFALPLARGGSVVDVLGNVVSEPYVEATLRVLHLHGIRTERTSSGFRVPGGQHFRGGSLEVPGDASSAAYLFALGALTGGPVTVGGLPPHWPQADLALLKLLHGMGAHVERHGSEVRVSAPTSGAGHGSNGPASAPPHLRACRIDLDAAPDLAPLLAVLASFARGTSVLTGGAHLVGKESDRRAGALGLAHALGARAEDRDGVLRITGPVRHDHLELGDLDDHRMLFAASVAAAALPGRSRLGPVSSARKSYPGFFRDLRSLGVAVSEDDRSRREGRG